MMGLLTGTVLGAGLGMLLAPKAGSELRGAIGEQAQDLGNVASEQYKKASEKRRAPGRSAAASSSTRRAKRSTRGADEARGYASGSDRQRLQLGLELVVGQLIRQRIDRRQQTGSSFGTTSEVGRRFR